MLDVGFSEILLIAVVALIVIGPERLPRVARTMGHLFGRLQRYVAEVKADITREIELEELRKLQSTMQDAAREVEQSVSDHVQYIEKEVKQAESEAKKAIDEAVAPTSEVTLLPSVSPPESAAVPDAQTVPQPPAAEPEKAAEAEKKQA